MRWLSLLKQYLSSNKYATIENPEILREYDNAIHIETTSKGHGCQNLKSK